MKKPHLQEVTCPHCHGTQSEPEGVISTNCRACGKYFKLSASRAGRSARAPKTTREVFCVKCGAPNLIASAALSTQCVRCSHYLELGDKVIKGVQTGKLSAYDDVLFSEGCFFRGMEATGRRMDVRGKVFSILRATEEVTARAGSQISGEVHAHTVRVERGASLKVQTLECDRLLVSGEVEIGGVLSATEIILSDGATFAGVLHIPQSKLSVETGVTAQFDAIECNEIIVSGQVRLATLLVANRIVVQAQGVLSCPLFRAARIEVNPGGTLQGRVEKFVAEALLAIEPEPAPVPSEIRPPT